MNSPRSPRSVDDINSYDSSLSEPWRQVSGNFAEVLRAFSVAALQVVGVSTPEEIPTFQCPVCCENKPLEQRFTLKNCTNNDHKCCKTCVETFFRDRIMNGRVFGLFCLIGASKGGCNSGHDGDDDDGYDDDNDDDDDDSETDIAAATHEEIEECFAHDEEILEKYRRFRKMKINPSLRECPDCQALVETELDQDECPIVPEITCGECGSSFCYYHAAAHRNRSCKEYEAELSIETKSIAKTFGTKDCPKCTFTTEKNGGCNHMTCQACQTDWCWICGHALTVYGPYFENPVFWHYSDDNVESGCWLFADPEMHPDADEVRRLRRYREPSACLKRFVSPITGISVLMVAVGLFVAAAVFLVLYLTSCLTIWLVWRLVGLSGRSSCERTAWNVMTSNELIHPLVYIGMGAGALVFALVFLPLCLVWGLVATVLWFFLWTGCHVPGLRRIVPTTLPTHLKFFIYVPLKGAVWFGSLVLPSEP